MSVSAQYKGNSNAVYMQAITNLVDFFNVHAYDAVKQAYLSEIDNQGTPISDKIYTVALNRCIYGLAYSSQFFPQYLDSAKKSANFALGNLIGADSIGKFSHSYIENKTPHISNEFDIWQQAYGLCGLTELYRVTRDQNLLIQIHQLHDAFVMRFHDSINGGFYGNYNIETGQVSGSKTLQALMYPITAYMGNLWLADTANRAKYEPIIAEHLQLLETIAWNPETHWVNLKFTDDWKVCTGDSPETPCFTVCPGHNFQLASLFLRATNWTFISNEKRESYKRLGTEIIDATLKANIYANGSIAEGFYSEVNPQTNQITDYRKTWWQHCEAIIALSLAAPAYNSELEKLQNFFFTNFTDNEFKGEYFLLTQDNQPITSELKGSMGKSMYHTIEMIRFLIEMRNYK